MTNNDGSEFNELERHLWDTLILMGDKLEKATAERDEAIKELQQVKTQKLQAVKVLVGADECCDECQDASENENRRRVGGDDEQYHRQDCRMCLTGLSGWRINRLEQIGGAE